MLSADFIAGIKIVFLLWAGLDKEHEHFLILFFFSETSTPVMKHRPIRIDGQKIIPYALT